DEEKKAWEAFCQKQGVTGAAMLRRMIQHVTQGEVKFKHESKKPKDGVLRVRFNKKDIPSIEARLKDDGFATKSEWIRAIILNVLDKHLTFTENEIFAIREANRELSSIGRNLNQIARKLNIDPDKAEGPEEKLLVEIAKEIREQQTRIMKLLDRSENRWSIE
ncbi:plasmid mobilization protein, partial [Thiolapillus sp.]|uniref:plasmid mobilization protein n=1 Tax=Thiolapillus sp. TaxID=2017437 RepID=UPI003AF71469